MGSTAHIKYRPDVDGLRAVAVLLVVAFHAFPSVVRGGFVGVDVFFVISGYLISTIILESLDDGRFSFVTFYARRIARIFPALITVLACCYALGWHSMFSGEFAKLIRHIGAGAGFLSNIALWKESGYFDTASNTKPLLHLWSLGIEEQFYIVWPLLLWASVRRRVHPLWVITLVGVGSFAFNLWSMNRDPVADFYSPLTRFWELAIGAGLASASLHHREWFDGLGGRLADGLSVAGMGLVLVGAGVVAEGQPFPGWYALLPTLGTALLISAGPSAWLNRTALSRSAVVWIGLISYPLYLWHWPLLSFERVVLGGPAPAAVRIATVVLAVILAWLTYKLIESPLRFRPDKRRVALGLLGAMFVVGAGAVLSYKLERRSRLPRKFLAMNAVGESGWAGGVGDSIVADCGLPSPSDRAMFAECFRDSRESPRYALVGDSKAGSLVTGFFRTSSPGHRWLFMGSSGAGVVAPLPVISDSPVYAGYQPAIRMAVASLARNPTIETVVLAGATRGIFDLPNAGATIEDLPSSPNFDIALDGVSRVARTLVAAGKKVVLVVDNPTLADPMVCLKRVTGIGPLDAYLARREHPGCRITVARHLELSRQYREMLEAVARLDPAHIRVFDTIGHMCDVMQGICLPTKDGRLMYSFDDHVSDYASGVIGRDLNAFLQRF